MSNCYGYWIGSKDQYWRMVEGAYVGNKNFVYFFGRWNFNIHGKQITRYLLRGRARLALNAEIFICWIYLIVGFLFSSYAHMKHMSYVFMTVVILRFFCGEMASGWGGEVWCGHLRCDRTWVSSLTTRAADNTHQTQDAQRTVDFFHR